MANQVNVWGLGRIYVQFPGDTVKLLGEALDMTDISERGFFHDVPMDRNGGPQGPPGEVQFLGDIIDVRLNLSTYDPAVAALVRKRSINATAGKVIQAEVGALMLTTRGIRVTLLSVSTGVVRNFPTCLVRQAIEVGHGTKFSAFVCQFEAHRTPTGTYVDVIENALDTDIPGATTTTTAAP